jgi:enoyl-CoA hydratase/long-chain 3-hydroxyacyl-CoA dehydrogenase
MEYLEDVAVKTASDIASGRIKLGKKKSVKDYLMNFALSTTFVKNKVFETAKGKVMKQTKGLYPSPLKILDVVRTGMDKGSVAGYAAEAKAFGELAMTPEARGLISLFHGQTECKKNAFGKPERPAK